jgi:enoyl-CoA hydratase/carnithine racemase
VTQTLFTVDESIATLTFNRPDARNAMTWAMYDALVAACDRVDADASIRVLVLKGAGGKAFVSGTDISQFTDLRTREDALAYERRVDEVVDRLERVARPTIAQVQGVASGGGLMLALGCDLRVCTPGSRFGVPIARTLGNCLSAANVSRLVDLVGPARAKDLLFTGRLVPAEEWAAMGLVNRIVADEGLDDAVQSLAREVAGNAPLTVRSSKEMVRRVQAHRRLPADEGNDLVTMCYLSQDFREGVTAFIERRPPRFTGT